MKKRNKRSGKQVFLRFLFVVYVAAMIWLLFGQRWGTEIYTGNKASSMNLQPFATVKMYWRILQNSSDNGLLRHALINLVGNVVMFIPLGFFAPYLVRELRKFWKAMLLLLCVIVTIEIVQFFTFLGTCDVDDLILNMAGVLIGWVFWRVRRP